MADHRLRLSGGASWHHPRDLVHLMEQVQPLSWGDGGVTPDRGTAHAVVSALGTLHHILTHPAGTEAVVAQLREARRILREDPDHD